MSNIINIQLKKGHYVWWDIKLSEISKEVFQENLTKVGLGDLMPRNDYKTALIRALRKLLKQDDNDRFYRRVEQDTNAHFFVVLPKWVYEENIISDVSYQKELKITLNKKSGEINFDATHTFCEQIKISYREAQKHLDASQLRSVITHIVNQHCDGVTLKKHGGIYYIPEKSEPKLNTVRDIFNSLPSGLAALYETPVYKDDSTDAAVEAAVSQSIFDEMLELVKDVMQKEQEGKLTERVVGNRGEDAKTLLNRIKIHEDDLRTQAAVLANKAEALEAVLIEKANHMQQNKPMSMVDALKVFV